MEMTGGQALARQLVLEGITDLFGIPGVQLDWAVDGLRQVADRIRYVVPRHEQTTSYMADGYARTTGKIGACMVVPGPGMLNAMAGLSTAYACNSPVLAIVGNIHSSGVGRGLGLLHEINNQTGVLAAVTKWQGSAATPQSVPGLVREAVRRLRSGRPCPVGIEIAHDVLSATADVELIAPPAGEDGRLRPDPDEVERAAAVLDRARFPVIYVGGGVLAACASKELQALAERLQAPVVMGENGRGALSDRHPLALNALGGRAVFAHADAVLVVGSRFVDTAVGKPLWPSEGVRYVYLNVDPSAWAPPRAPGPTITADALLGLEALAAAVARRPDRGTDLDRVRSWASAQSDAIEPQRSWVRALRAAIPDDGILVNELTQVGYYAARRVSRLRARHVPQPRLPGHARLRLSDGARRGGRQSGSGGGQHHRGRRLRLGHAGTRHRPAPRSPPGDRRVQRWALRQRAPDAAGPVQAEATGTRSPIRDSISWRRPSTSPTHAATRRTAWRRWCEMRWTTVVPPWSRRGWVRCPAHGT